MNWDHLCQDRRTARELRLWASDISVQDIDRVRSNTAGVADESDPSKAGILAVDDEPTLLNALRRLLKPYGLRTMTADSGSSAIALLEQESGSIGVVISDFTMPGMNGAELLHIVRTRWPDITRILLTGNVDMASASAAVNDGGLSSLFTKPVRPDEFREAISQALAHHRSLVETRRLRKLADEQATRLASWNVRLESQVAERTADLERANVNLRKGMLQTVRLLLVLIEQRLPQRIVYYKAVARLAGRLAERAGQSPDDIRAIQAGALIHDIGLIGLPDALLRPGAVPVANLVEYERHPLLGQHMLSSVEQLQDMAGWIRHHHERWDGSGYPDRLVGPAIPLAAQLIGLAGAFNDAIAREGGTAGSWRWTQSRAGVFDPVLIGYLDDEVNARPIGPTAELAISKLAAGEAGSASGSDTQDYMVPIRKLLPGMVLTRDIETTSGVVLLAEGETLTNRQIERLWTLIDEGKLSGEKAIVRA